MFYYSDNLLDSLLLSDIEHGDLTTRTLGIGDRIGIMTFSRRLAGRVSGISVAEKLLTKLSLKVETHIKEGIDVAADTVLLTAYGKAEQLHQGWKVAQNVIEWSCGVANYMADMLAMAQSINPSIRIACTRKSIPGTKSLAIAAICHGGGILHRAGIAETILLFANHRHFYKDPNDWLSMITTLRSGAPEKQIIVEADNINEALCALSAQPDLLQLDKFTPAEIKQVMNVAKYNAPNCIILLAGGVTKHNIIEFAKTGINLIVTSSPYYAMPEDIKVRLQPV